MSSRVNWRKLRFSAYFLHLATGNSFGTGRRGPYADTDPEKLSKCKRGIVITYNILTSHLGLLVLLIGYTCLGAVIFQAIEGTTGRKSDGSIIGKHRTGRAEELFDRLVDENLIYDVNETEILHVIEDNLKNYEDWLSKKGMLNLKPSANKLWDFYGSLFFSATVSSTIGYGNIYPVTSLGKWITMLYAIIGMPIYLISIADIGLLVTKMLQAFLAWGSMKCNRKIKPSEKNRRQSNGQHKNGTLYGSSETQLEDIQENGTGLSRNVEAAWQDTDHNKIKASAGDHRHRHAKGFITKTASKAKLNKFVFDEDIVATKLDETAELRLPLHVPIIITLLYTLINATVFMTRENWTFTNAFYFTFISFTTIGFGDVVPDSQKHFIASFLLILLGLVLVAMLINALIQFTNQTLGKAKGKVNELAERKLGTKVDPDQS